MPLYRALVVPPGFLRKLVRGYPTDYSFGYLMPVGSGSEAIASYPPLKFALEHLTWAVPFWSVVLVGLYEFAALISHRLRAPAHPL